MIGKLIRLDRIMNRKTKKIVMVPMDHGVSLGPIDGLIKMRETINKVVEGGANSIVLHKGIVKGGYRGYGKDVGLIIHLSGSTSLCDNPLKKVPVASVEEAIKLGADGVSVHINFGGPDEQEMLKNLGETSYLCEEWGMPLLVMAYPRGGKAKDMLPDQAVPFVARVAYELGADLIKVPYTGSQSTFEKVVAAVDVPVVMAGGDKTTLEESLKTIEDAVSAGAAGVSCGRNVFQSENPTAMVKAISRLIHEGVSVKEAIKELKPKGK